MPLDALITGRIATLAGESGLGWVEAIGIRDGRVAFAGSEVDLETRADPHTERFQLEPDQVAIPGLTDAHLHLAQAALAARQVDLTSAGTVAEGMEAVRRAAEGTHEPGAWILGHGWDVGRWGRWPMAADVDAVAPGRRVALWAHDHHALLASTAALGEAGLDRDRPDPPNGVIRRAADGTPEGALLEGAAGLVAALIPPPSDDELEAAIRATGRELLELGVVACHDPGTIEPDPGLTRSFPVYARLAEAGRLPLRVHACLRREALATAIERGIRSGQSLGGQHATVGWLKLFADGALGSRTAALLGEYEVEADRPLPPERQRGVWVTEPGELAELAGRAAGAGIATQIHAIGDAAARAALDALEGVPGRAALPLMARIEHVQFLDPADRSRFARAGIAASIQPVHLRSDADAARRAWGGRAERSAYAWGSLAAAGALLGFGTDAPVEPFDPWPGLAIAMTRRDAGWDDPERPFGPDEALTLDQVLRAACVGPALTAGELDRGRLTVGQRADVVVLAAAALDEPAEPGGALATARPDLVMLDGDVVFER